MKFAEKFPTFSRLGRFVWKWTKRWIRPVVFTLICLGTLVALVVGEENYRTGRAWEKYKADARVRGEKMTMPEMAPPLVPDEENFATTPLLKAIFTDSKYAAELSKRLELSDAQNSLLSELGDRTTGKRTDWAKLAEYFRQPEALADLQKHDAELAEIATAILRRHSRFPIAYDKEPAVSILLLHVSPLLNLEKLFYLRGLAELGEGKSDEALGDALTLLRLSQATRDEPTYISKAVVMAGVGRGLQMVWEGLASRRWSEPQLTALQQEIQKIDFLAQIPPAQQGERIFFINTMEWLGHLDGAARMKAYEDFLGSNVRVDLSTQLLRMPQFSLNRALLAGNEYFDQYIQNLINLKERRLLRDRVELAEQVFAEKFNFDPFKAVWQGLSTLYAQFAYTQTSLDEAALACALERFRLSQGHYPAKLDELVPKYIERVPLDLISGQPLHYQLTENANFILYSTGWKERDKQGKLRHGDNFNELEDNWIWQYPEP